MIKKKDINYIERLLNNKKIIDSKLLSNSFGINCLKIRTNDGNNYVVKYYHNKIKKFNAIKAELNNLVFFNKLNLNFFPKVYTKHNDYLIISYFNNNGLQPKNLNRELLLAIIKLHSIKNDKYGFDFNTQIGGLKQINTKCKDWIKFYRDERLGYVFNLINSTNPMNTSINKKIEYLINNLKNFIPSNPKPSLLHGDLWEGNILFDNKNFVGFIDPGTFYGHNELEIAYLTWFNPIFIKNNFLDKYNEVIKIDKEYKKYEPVYQLYYSLLNVLLWDRKYVSDVKRLLDKINI